MDYDSMTDPEFLYIGSNDVPTDINGIPFSTLGTETVKVLRNKRIHILKPDGKLYTVDGVLVK